MYRRLHLPPRVLATRRNNNSSSSNSSNNSNSTRQSNNRCHSSNSRKRQITLLLSLRQVSFTLPHNHLTVSDQVHQPYPPYGQPMYANPYFTPNQQFVQMQQQAPHMMPQPTNGMFYVSNAKLYSFSCLCTDKSARGDTGWRCKGTASWSARQSHQVSGSL